MELPFFLTKIFGLFKRKKKAKKQAQTFATYRPTPNYHSGYIKHYPDGMWHTADNLDRLQFDRFRQSVQDVEYHYRNCTRLYKMETLDGSEYYLCQHGVRIR